MAFQELKIGDTFEFPCDRMSYVKVSDNRYGSVRDITLCKKLGLEGLLFAIKIDPLDLVRTVKLVGRK